MGPRPAVAMAAAAARAAAAGRRPWSTAPPALLSRGARHAPVVAAGWRRSRGEIRRARIPPIRDDAARERCRGEPAAGPTKVEEKRPSRPELGQRRPGQATRPTCRKATSIPRAPRRGPSPSPSRPRPRRRCARRPRARLRCRHAGPPAATRRRLADLYTLIGIVVLAVAIFVPVYFMVLSGDETSRRRTRSPSPAGRPRRTRAPASARPPRAPRQASSWFSTARRSTASPRAARHADPGRLPDRIVRIDNSDDQSRQDSLVLYAEDERRQRATSRDCSTSAHRGDRRGDPGPRRQLGRDGHPAGRRRGHPRHGQSA